ncbi:PREDICTED: epididymal-specific lipocalin-12 isoform X2 [Chinchilla lanigera]|uniref:epididymal-specific lipocalin-12 isoform X2 n=1 Tax=Chinchilla lanigera TaxID=34839 RepID=UPI0006991C77|nr:PREDICTED: epididymal-specific lipocalin-12 isoform X2 [Chinchilla lanigera]
MGPWCTPWLWLCLHGVLQAQALVPLPVQPPLSQFHSEQFQGAWFILGLAGNAFKKQDRPLLNPYTAIFELKNNTHFEVLNSMIRGKHCDTWSYLLMPTPQPARFTVDHGGPSIDTEHVQVVDTNYTSFALMLSHRQAPGQPVIRVSLLGPGRCPLGHQTSSSACPKRRASWRTTSCSWSQAEAGVVGSGRGKHSAAA